MDYADLKYTVGTASRSFAVRAAECVNVKEGWRGVPGAVGDGIADDFDAIQSAIEHAFGDLDDPHREVGKLLNKPLYFPSGIYNISEQIEFRDIFGAKIFGNGSGSTHIVYTGGTNIQGGATHIFVFRTLRYSTVSGMTLRFGSSPTDPLCAQFGMAPGVGNDGNANIFIDMAFEDGRFGVLVGWPGGYGHGSLGSEFTWVNCHWKNFETYGLKLFSQNALNHVLLGGSFVNCAGIAAHSTQGGASMPTIIGTYFDNGVNTNDIYDTADGGSRFGCYSKSKNFLTVADAQQLLAGCYHNGAAGGTFLHNGTFPSFTEACRSTNGIISGPKTYVKGSTFGVSTYLDAVATAYLDDVVVP